MSARRFVLITGFSIVILFAGGRTARAQDKPHNGFAMGYPAAAGVLWNVSDTVALWPELIAIRHASTSANDSEYDTDAIGGGIRVLLYLAPVQAFRPYIAPQFDFTHATSSSGSATPGLATTTSTYSGAASFGAQYALSARFGVFGEVGLEYDHETGTGLIASHGNSTGTRNAVGVMVFF